jgi:hypothetical protein
MDQEKHEVIGLRMSKEEQGVLGDTIITREGIPIGENTTTQVNLL